MLGDHQRKNENKKSPPKKERKEIRLKHK